MRRDMFCLSGLSEMEASVQIDHCISDEIIMGLNF